MLCHLFLNKSLFNYSNLCYIAFKWWMADDILCTILMIPPNVSGHP